MLCLFGLIGDHDASNRSPSLLTLLTHTVQTVTRQNLTAGYIGLRGASALRVMGRYLGWIVDLGMSRSPGCRCVV